MGFVRISSVDLIELFVTVIKGLGDSEYEVDDSNCPPFLDCLLLTLWLRYNESLGKNRQGEFPVSWSGNSIQYPVTNWSRWEF